MKTNGLTKLELLPKLAEAGVDKMDVSLYGATAQTHDAMTHVPGSFNATIKGIKLIKKLGIQLQINYSVTNHNYHEAKDMLALARQFTHHIGMSRNITKRHKGEQSSPTYQMSRDELTRFYQDNSELLRQPDFSPDKPIKCGCAVTNCGISATGEVYPCIGAPFPAGNLKEQSFQEIWDHSPTFEFIRRLSIEDLKSCSGCGDRPYCTRSPGPVYTNTGDYTGPDPFTCMDAAVTRDLHKSPPCPSST